jgi:hypothetical protein
MTSNDPAVVESLLSYFIETVGAEPREVTQP